MEKPMEKHIKFITLHLHDTVPRLECWLWVGRDGAKADAFVGIDVFGASAPGGTCTSDSKQYSLHSLLVRDF